MLVKELAKTLGRFGFRVNALVPGAIAAGGFIADLSLSKHIPLGGLGQSEDLAPMALTVLSNRLSAHVTGAAFVVDGGLSLTNWFTDQSRLRTHDQALGLLLAPLSRRWRARTVAIRLPSLGSHGRCVPEAAPSSHSRAP